MTKYYGDGSGRDKYIITNNGGLIPTYKDNDYLRTFYSSLRKNPKLGVPRKLMKSTERQMHEYQYAPRVREAMKQSFIRQM